MHQNLTYLGYIVFNHFLVSKITFVAYKEFVYIITSIAVNFLQPLFHVVKRLLISAIVHHNNAMGSSVVTRSNSTESLLAGCVPLHNRNMDKNEFPYTKITKPSKI